MINFFLTFLIETVLSIFTIRFVASPIISRFLSISIVKMSRSDNTLLTADFILGLLWLSVIAFGVVLMFLLWIDEKAGVDAWKNP